MPTHIRIVHAHDFVRATSDGKLDFEMSKKVLREVASAAAHVVDYEILPASRKAQVQMSVPGLWHVAAELSNLREAFGFPRKAAVLCPIEEFDNAAFFARCAENRGFRVQAFTSFEDAIDWLIEVEPHA